ncbi:MAG TPA: NGG1p interacting factor NIF3 [Gammaproteobacteria bacterium]|nr:NGG1p interacting factor NIF3 [Gammaproteobacteria bacterium]
MYKISFLVPVTHVDQVKLAVFNEGAGKIGNYQHCAWQTLGEGQFMPNEEADPFTGQKNQLNKVPEYCVQVICEDDVIRAVVAALKKAHPYEEPAYDVVKLELFM